MKLKVLLSVALIALVIAGCTSYPPNGTAITLSYPDGQTPGEENAPLEDSRGIGTTTVRGLRVLNDTTIGGSATVGGDVTITGGLEVTGGVTGTNVLTTGDQTIAGIKTFSTPPVITGLTGPLNLTVPTAVATATPGAIINNLGAANVAFEVRDAATPIFSVGQAGVWTASGVGTLAGYTSSAAANVTAPTAVATATPAFMVDSSGAGNVLLEVRDSATPVFRVLNGGSVAANAVYSYIPVSAKTNNYSVTTADTGLTIKSSGNITMTLPGAVAGLQYCIVNYDGGDLTIDFTDATDVALNEVNSPGDRVTNTTAFDSICLQAIDTTNWVTLSSLGTWADGN